MLILYPLYSAKVKDFFNLWCWYILRFFFYYYILFDEKVLKYFYQLKQSNEERIVKQFQCKFWPEEANIPENPDPMLEMIEEVNKWQCQVNNPTIVVHCMYVVGCRFVSYACNCWMAKKCKSTTKGKHLKKLNRLKNLIVEPSIQEWGEEKWLVLYGGYHHWKTSLGAWNRSLANGRTNAISATADPCKPSKFFILFSMKCRPREIVKFMTPTRRGLSVGINAFLWNPSSLPLDIYQTMTEVWLVG